MPKKANGQPWTPANATTEKERLMYQVALSGHEYDSDNRRV